MLSNLNLLEITREMSMLRTVARAVAKAMFRAMARTKAIK